MLSGSSGPRLDDLIRFNDGVLSGYELSAKDIGRMPWTGRSALRSHVCGCAGNTVKFVLDGFDSHHHHARNPQESWA